MASILLLALSAIAAPVLAQDDSLFTCDGTQKPNWDHCEDVMDQLGWRGATPGIDVVNNEEGGSCTNICRRFTTKGDSKNCELSICFYTDTCMSVAQSDFVTVYDNVMKQHCEPQGAGAVYTIGEIEYFAWNNPDYSPPSTGDKRHVLERGIAGVTLTVDEFEERYNASALHQQVKRDDTWQSISVSRDVPKNGDRRKASSILSAGVTETWSFSETETVSTSTSAEMGAGWEIFSASFGITTEESYSTTIESGKQFTSGDCPDGGIVYFVPLWTNYYGYWESDEDTTIEIWIPSVDGQGYAAGKFETECIG